jgi:hypothetical protein
VAEEQNVTRLHCAFAVVPVAPSGETLSCSPSH